MRKLLIFLAGLAVVIAVAGETILPRWAHDTAETLLHEAGAEEAETMLHTSPGVLLLFGKIDDISASAKGLRLGQLRLDRAELRGADVRLDAPALFLDRKVHVKSAEELKLTGTVSAESLRDLLARRVDKLDNIEVALDEEGVHATAQAKIFGRKADILLEGKIVEEPDALFFHMTRFDIKNAAFGKANIGDFFGDILITKLSALPLKAQIDSVEYRDGAIVVRLSCRNPR